MNPAEEARKQAMAEAATKAGRTPLDDDKKKRAAKQDGRAEFARRRGESRVESMERHTQVAAPMGDPTMDPMTAIWDVADRAGYGSRGSQDAMMGADKMVTGEADAMKCLVTPSNTEGSPCQMAEDESIYSDDANRGDMSVLGEQTKEWDDDWTEEL